VEVVFVGLCGSQRNLKAVCDISVTTMTASALSRLRRRPVTLSSHGLPTLWRHVSPLRKDPMNHRPALLATVIALAASLVTITGCATTPAPTTIADTAARTPQLSTLNRLIVDAGLADTLRGPGPFTVFAPTDEAFKAVPAATLEALGKDKEKLKAVLSYHVLAGKVMAADVKSGNVKSVQGADLAVAKAGNFVTVEDAVVGTADVEASNGVVHLIDRVLMPPVKK
jgi:uncharacterized surface protein with fasciclin (FAS1) repeats